MSSDLIKAVTITCPECNTSIRFDILSGHDEIQALFSAVSSLECPKCKNSLASNAQDMVRAINEYNGAVSKLSDTAKATGSRLN